MKLKFKWRRFDSVEEMQAKVQTVLNLTKKHFQDAFKKWKERWERCVHFQGDCFERDGAE
jgi:hypothetical protein